MSIPNISVHQGLPFTQKEGYVFIASSNNSGDPDSIGLPKPKPYLGGPQVYPTSPAMQQYGQAASLLELSASFKDPSLPFMLFNLAAYFPDMSLMGLVINPNVSYAIVKVAGEDVLAWWQPGNPVLIICPEEGKSLRISVPEEVKNGSKLGPSELLYALSVVSQNVMIGSDSFTVIVDDIQTTIIWNDVEDKNFFSGATIPRIEN